MRRYVFRRLALMVPGVLFVSLVSFMLIQLSPGDPVTAYAGVDSDPEYRDRLRTEYGLDRSVPEQYVRWVANAASGDLGVSFSHDRRVSTLLAEHIPRTLELSLLSLLVSAVLAVAVGTIAALHHGSITDTAATSFALALISIPSFVLAFGLVLLFSVTWDVLPPGGFVPFSESPSEHLVRLVLPALALGAGTLASLMRYARSSVLEVVQENFVRTARAKGLRERRVILRHVLRNALVPVATIIGLQLGAVLEGSYIIETIFSWPGIGRLTVDSIRARDYPMVQGAVLVGALLYMVATLITDIVYSILDPRIRLGGTERE